MIEYISKTMFRWLFLSQMNETILNNGINDVKNVFSLDRIEWNEM
jgi:hypothetical protein